MATVATGDRRVLSVKKTGKGSSEQYDYDRWFDGQEWVLKRGKDWNCLTTLGVRTNLYQAAKRRGVRITTYVSDYDTIHVMAIKDDLPSPEVAADIEAESTRRAAKVPDWAVGATVTELMPDGLGN